MISFLKERGREKEKGEIIDLLLFVAISAMTVLLTFGSFDPNGHLDAGGTNSFTIFGITFYHEINKTSPIYMVLPVVGLFLILAILFMIRRIKSSKLKADRLLLSVFVGFAVCRIVGNLAFPYGEQSYSFFYFRDNLSHEVLYAGYEIEERLLGTLNEVCFIFYFYLFFSYIRSFGRRHMMVLINICLYSIIGIVVVMNIYSFIFERDILGSFFHYLIEGGEFEQKLLSTKSFLSHRNVYGFFIMLAIISVMILFFKKPNPLLLIGFFYFMFTEILTGSRTSCILSGAVCLAAFVSYPIFQFKKHKTYSFITIGIAALIIVGISLIFTVFKDTKIGEIFFNFKGNLVITNTLESRIIHWKLALSMMISPFVLIFGYGRVPFANIYYTYETNVSYEALYVAHNGYIQVLVDMGITGLLMVTLGFGLLFYFIIRLFQKKRKDLAVPFLIDLIACMIHSFIEPRMLFMMEGTNVIFIAILLLPLTYCYYDVCYPLNKDVIKKDYRVYLLSGIQSKIA